MHRWYWMSATLAGLLITAAVYQIFFTQKIITQHTTYGENKKIELSDATQIALNANSTIRYSTFFDLEREVWLDGEAFIEVEEIAANKESDSSATEHELIKFTDYTERIAVEVTGTSFNVKNRDNKTQVVLNTGKVKLKKHFSEKSQTNILIMQPGDMVEILESDGEMNKKVVNPEVYASWRDNKLLCYDTPLKSIAQVVKNNYGVQMVFEGTLPINNLNLLLKVLTESIGLHIKGINNIIFAKDI